MELLPDDCIAAILSHTTPEDVCRLSLVSKSFRSAADSNIVWSHFLPSDYHSIVSQSPSLIALAPSKKSLYLALSDHPVIIDHGKKSIQLDKKSGKKCYILGARALSFQTFCGRGWTLQQRTLPESRFPVVAELEPLGHMRMIRGVINTISLSPSTQYGAFLVFKITNADGSYTIPMRSSVSIAGGDDIVGHICLRPKSVEDEDRRQFRRPIVRSDGGWLEIEMCKFFNSGLEDKELQMTVLAMNEYSEASLLIEGMELRPKEDN